MGNIYPNYSLIPKHKLCVTIETSIYPPKPQKWISSRGETLP